MLLKGAKIVVPALAITLSGCMTTNPYTGEQKVNKSVTYGVGAAVACAIAGAGESGKRARNAALGCGLIGASVGAYMDHQEQALRERLAQTGVGVERYGDQIKLVMPGNISFDTNRYDIRSNFYPVLNDVALVLKEYDRTNIRVKGHTDSTGTLQINQRLSEQRARSVRDYLVNQQVPSTRVYYSGHADKFPIASNTTAYGREQNRRVEIDLEVVR